VLSKFVLMVRWDKCDTGDVKIETAQDVLDYVRACIGSNADFDHIDLQVKIAYIDVEYDLK